MADVTVIDRAQIERAQGRTLASLLTDSPGLQMSSNGGQGKSSRIYTRGGDVKQTVLLIDGVRYGSATLGEPSMDNLPLDQIERIEIVRGAMASMYGADAASGVIQIFTRRGSAGFRPNASVTVGSDRYNALSAGFSGGEGMLSYSVQANRTDMDGFSATNRSVGTSNYNPDRDGFRQSSLSANADLAFNKEWRLSGNLLRSSGVSWFDDGFASSGQTVDTNVDLTSSVTGLALNGKLTDDWQSTWRVSESVDVSDDKVANKSFYISRIATRQMQLAWENRITTPVGQALVALERLRQSVDNANVDYAVKKRIVNSLVLGLNGGQGPHDWQASARNDQNSQYGREWTGSLGYGLHLSDQWRVGAVAGTSFVAPSFNQLYWPNYGNAALKAQHGLSREVNIGWELEDHSIKLTRYDNRIHDFILVNPTSVSNLDGVRLAGWTLAGSSSWQSGGTRLYTRGSMDWLDAHSMADGSKLVRRANRFATLIGGVEVGKVSYEASLKASEGMSETHPATFTPVHLPGYAILGASVNWGFMPDWKLALRAENLGNKAYETAYGYNQPGMQFFLTLSYSPTR